jgi:hypothetical protein
LRRASTHVYYELWMLLRTGEATLARTSADDVVNNALVESFALHMRALCDFLWPSGADDDDVLALDYFPGKWTASGKSAFKGQRVDANKGIAHISYRRLDVQPPEGKSWEIVTIAEGLHGAMSDFYDLVDHGLLSEEWTRRGFPERVRLPGGGIRVGAAASSMPTMISSDYRPK